MDNNKKSVPEIRFPGFTDPWEQRKLEDIFAERHILSKITEEYPRLSFTIEEGVIHPEDRKTNKRDFLMKDESNKKFLVTELEDIIYNPANVVWGALHRNTYGKGCLSPIYKIFSTYENPAFIECILRSPSFIRALSQKTEGTVVKLKTLKPEAFLEMSISVAPQRAEQDAIAAVFEQIDNLITLHQRKCEELKKYKKGLLQQMFPQHGEAFPRVRFPGFTDPWEQRKFDEITFPAGIRNKDNLPLEPYSITNDRGFLPQTEAHDDFGYMQNTDRKAYMVVSPNSFGYNPARINVGSIGYYEGAENVIVSSLYEIFKTQDYIDDHFLMHWFKSDLFPRWIEKFQEGSVRQYFYYDKLCECSLTFPSIEEQRKISSLIDSIDTTITLHQCKYY